MSALRNALFASFLAGGLGDQTQRSRAPATENAGATGSLAQMVHDTSALVASSGIEGVITARIKSDDSVRAKIARKGLARHEVLDQLALRVHVATEDECYGVMALVRDRYPEVHGAYDDYIQAPKANGYRSLHTAVVGPAGDVFEVQVRTHAMHADAEHGVAAHWRYKLES